MIKNNNNKKTCVIIPCYKVRNHIIAVVKECLNIFNFVICVDDKCPQKSGLFLKKKINSNKLKIIFHKNNRGVGGAMKSGYFYCLKKNFDFIVKVDGDGQMYLKDAKKIIKKLNNGCDYVKGNRFLRKDYFLKSPKIRYFGNYFLSLITKITAGNTHIKDPLNGYTGIKLNVLKCINFNHICDNFFFETSMLIILSRKKFKICNENLKISYEGQISNFNILKEIFVFSFFHLKYFFLKFFIK